MKTFKVALRSVLFFICICVITLAYASSTLAVEIGTNRGNTIEKSELIVEDGIEYIHVKTLGDRGGYRVYWDKHTDSTILYRTGEYIKITKNDKSIQVNSNKFELEREPIILEGKMMVPIKSLSNYLNTGVTWVDNSGEINTGKSQSNPKLSDTAQDNIKNKIKLAINKIDGNKYSGTYNVETVMIVAKNKDDLGINYLDKALAMTDINEKRIVNRGKVNVNIEVKENDCNSSMHSPSSIDISINQDGNITKHYNNRNSFNIELGRGDVEDTNKGNNKIKNIWDTLDEGNIKDNLGLITKVGKDSIFNLEGLEITAASNWYNANKKKNFFIIYGEFGITEDNIKEYPLNQVEYIDSEKAGKAGVEIQMDAGASQLTSMECSGIFYGKLSKIYCENVGIDTDKNYWISFRKTIVTNQK